MTNGPEWYRPRTYRHLDIPVGPNFISRVEDPHFVAKHSFSPLLHYVKRQKRYRSKIGKTVFKDRPISYASHRDACILGKYSWTLSQNLEVEYARRGLRDSVIAYRKLGRGNYDFSAEVASFARSIAPCMVLAFDITGFFDSLDHRLLKRRLKLILGVEELPKDWYAVFKHVTQHTHFNSAEIRAHPSFADRFSPRHRRMIASVSELKAAGVSLIVNPNRFGIPQGTPISSTLANLYMIDLDQYMTGLCGEHGALYRRYSDDLIVVCRTEVSEELERLLEARVLEDRLTLQQEKTERTRISEVSSAKGAQYLGFVFDHRSTRIRPGSLSKQWRKLRRSSRRTQLAGEAAIAAGKADRIYTRAIRKRFSALGPSIRNFSSYARRSSDAFGDRNIIRQALRLERELECIIHGFRAVDGLIDE